MIQKGDLVKHYSLGRGIVVDVSSDIAEVDFLNSGKKKVLLSFLTPVDNENLSDNHISKLKLINTAIDIITDNKKSWMYLYDIKTPIKQRMAADLPEEQLIKHLEVDKRIVFKNCLLNIRNNLLKNGDEVIEIVSSNVPTVTKSAIDNFEDFQNACAKLRVNDSAQVFFARCILSFANNHNSLRLSINKITEYVYGAYLYQISIGFMYNMENHKNNPFYQAVENVYQNLGEEEIVKKAFEEIKKYINNHIIHQFLISKDFKYSFYRIGDNAIAFSDTFLSLVAHNSAKIDKQLVNKLSYFLSTNNPNNASASAYSLDIKSGEDLKGKKIEKFEYTDELNHMRGYLTKDIYTRIEFKQIMTKFKIPNTKKNMDKCLDRLNYRLKTKEII